MSNPWDDPDTKAWVKSVRKDLIPKLRSSRSMIALVPEEPDVKMAVEIGMAILMDKPIIVAVPAGRTVPERLIRCADRIVDFDEKDPTMKARLKQAIEEVGGD